MIEVNNLTKFYGAHKAVDNISFSVKDGTVCGFCGPNGAGKSTTMNIMTGCLSATSGTVTIGGYDIFEYPTEAKKLIGYLPEQPPLYLEETPREYLRFIAEAKKVPRAMLRDEVERVMKETQISDVADRLIKNLSKGYKQRVGIAQTLLGKPKVIILDEPTVGLDPIQVVEIRDLIKNLGKRHTVILSSHILSEVQQMCDEIIIIAKGKLIAYDTAENLEKMLQPKVTLEVQTDASREESEAVLAEIEGIETAEYSEEDGLLLVRITTVPEKELEIRKVLSRKFAAIDRAVLKNDKVTANLEEIFIELTSGEAEPQQPEQEISWVELGRRAREEQDAEERFPEPAEPEADFLEPAEQETEADSLEPAEQKQKADPVEPPEQKPAEDPEKREGDE